MAARSPVGKASGLARFAPIERFAPIRRRPEAFATNCCPTYDPHVKLISILFGTGWWMPWHFFIVGSIVPMLFLLRWLRRTKPDATPQGGDVAYVSLLTIAFVLALATVVDGAMLGWKLAEVRGAAWGIIIGLAFCMLWTLLLFGVAKNLSVPKDDEETTMLPASIVFAVWHLGMIVANLTALRKIHG